MLFDERMRISVGTDLSRPLGSGLPRGRDKSVPTQYWQENLARCG